MPEAKKSPISKYHIKMIHTFKNALKMADSTYLYYLFETFGVTSSKDLNFIQGEGFMLFLKDEAISAGVWNHVDPEEKKYQKLKGRPGYATPAQLAFIEDLWGQVSRAKPEVRAKALRTFLQNHAGISDLRFLKGIHARKVITALQAMKQQNGK